jgi:hypothetical protein
MGCEEVEVSVVTDLYFPKDGLTVAGPQAGVQHQRRMTPHDDADVGNEPDVVIRNDVHVVGFLEGLISLNQRRRSLNESLCRQG